MNENFDLSNLKFISNSGEHIQTQNLRAYFDQRKKSMLTITDELNVGDVVKLKVTGQVVEICQINLDNIKYGGYIPDKNSVILFGQEDIESVISKKSEIKKI